MPEIQQLHQEPQFPLEAKEQREKSIALVTHDALSHAWGNKKWEDVTYAEIEMMLRSAYHQGCGELKIDTLPQKIGVEYTKQLLAAIMDQIPVVIGDLKEDQIGEVYMHFADAIPELKEEILRQALLILNQQETQKGARRVIARTLIILDQNFFSQLSTFGFTMKDEIDMARGLSGSRGMNLFEFAAACGGLTREFREAVFDEFSQGINWYIEFKKLSPEDAVDLLKEEDVTRREQLRKSFKIPPRIFGNERKIVSTYENIYEQAFPIDVEHMHSLGDQLYQAMEQADPARAEKIRNRKEHERVLFSPIVAAGELNSDGVSNPTFLYFEGEQITPAVYKPQNRDVERMREGISAGTNAQREWLASQIDQALMMDVIPPTILRDGPAGVGSVQEWVIGRVAFEHERWEMEANPAQLEDVVFDDVVKFNKDRHQGNFLIGYDGSVHAIDHGLILPVSDAPGEIISAPGFRMIGKEPSPRVAERIMKFRSSLNVQTALRACFDAALHKDAEAAWNLFEQGLEQLSPKDGSKGKYPFMHKNNARLNV